MSYGIRDLVIQGAQFLPPEEPQVGVLEPLKEVWMVASYIVVLSKESLARMLVSSPAKVTHQRCSASPGYMPALVVVNHWPRAAQEQRGFRTNMAANVSAWQLLSTDSFNSVEARTGLLSEPGLPRTLGITGAWSGLLWV